LSNIHINSGISGAYVTMPDLVVGNSHHLTCLRLSSPSKLSSLQVGTCTISTVTHAWLFTHHQCTTTGWLGHGTWESIQGP